MASKNSEPINVDRLLAVFGILSGVLALILSWQANQIARQQITPRVVVLDTSDYGAPLTSLSTQPNRMGYECFQRIRLTNLGGAPTAIVGYEAAIHFQEDTLRISSKEAFAQSDDSIQERISDFGIVLLDENGGFSPVFSDYARQNYLLKFPAKIDAYTTIDINPRVRLMTLDSRVVSALFPEPGTPNYDEVQNNYDPLTVVYALTLASGQVVRTPPIRCVYVSKRLGS